jgi:hypothetical protein
LARVIAPFKYHAVTTREDFSVIAKRREADEA